MLQLPYNIGRDSLLALRVAMLSALIMLLALGGVVYYQNEQANLVRHTLEVQRTIGDFRNSIQTVESAHRGYLLTADTNYIGVLPPPLRSPRDAFKALRQKTVDNPEQQARLSRLEGALDAKLLLIDRKEDLMRSGRQDEARALTHIGAGKTYMDSISRMITEIRAEEQDLLESRTADSDSALHWVYATIGIAILILGYTLVSIYGQMHDTVVGLAVERERYRKADAAKQVEIERRARAEAYTDLLIAKLEARNRALDQYAYLVSHDLQQPLRTVTGLIEALREDHPELAEGDVAEYFEMITGGAHRMQEMLLNLLRNSRDGRAEEFLPLDLERLVGEVEVDLAQLIEEEGCRLKCVGLPFCQGPPTGMRVLLQNLITNAIKYHAPGRAPEVVIEAEEVTVAESDTRWRITVSDNGRGISPAERERILEFGQRGDADDVDGHGLGLAACAEVAAALGGELEIESEVGKGSRFSFTVPTVPRLPTLTAAGPPPSAEGAGATVAN